MNIAQKCTSAVLSMLCLLCPAVEAFSEQVSRPEILVGAILVLTGDFAAWGNNCQKAIQLAAEELAARPTSRYQLRVLVEDSPIAKAASAVSAFR